MAGHTTTADAGVVFKGRMMTLTILEIREVDVDRIATQIAAQLERSPGFFSRMPVLLSLPDAVPDLARVCEVLSGQDLIVVGVLDASESAARAAGNVGLALMKSPIGSSRSKRSARSSRSNSERTRQDANSASPETADAIRDNGQANNKTPSRLVTRPVRSGQQIYARGGDLVIATSVSEGAEVLADGHIHIYGALRGRALAGAGGDVEARIFCRRFEPDLVAIAGCYKVADAMDEGVRCQAVQVSLDDDNLQIELQE